MKVTEWRVVQLWLGSSNTRSNSKGMLEAGASFGPSTLSQSRVLNYKCILRVCGLTFYVLGYMAYFIES